MSQFQPERAKCNTCFLEETRFILELKLCQNLKKMMLVLFLTLIVYIKLLYYWWYRKILYFSVWITESNMAVLNTYFFVNGGTWPVMRPNFSPVMADYCHEQVVFLCLHF